MRQVLAVLVLGVAMAVSASAAFAGDNREFPPIVQPSVTTEAPAQATDSVEVAGPTTSQLQLHEENREGGR